MARAFRDAQVAAAFRAYPPGVAAKLRALRGLIFDVASRTDGVGELEETLRWGQPSYITTSTRSGSTIRIDRVKAEPGRYAMYFHCRTSLVDTFRRSTRARSRTRATEPSCSTRATGSRRRRYGTASPSP